MSSYESLLPPGSENKYNISIFDNKNNKLSEDKYRDDIDNIVRYLENQNIISAEPSKSMRDLKVTLVGDQQYRLKIGNTQFYVASHGKEQDFESKQVTVIREKIVQNKFFKVLHKVISTIKHLFYEKEKFPPKGQRLPSEIIKQDYRLLRKSLDTGKSLFPEDRSGLLFPKLEKAIANTKIIENALRSQNPKQELNNIATAWLENAKNLPEGAEFSFMTGYVNDNEIMQPIMVRVYKKEDQLYLELYCDSPDVGNKITPLQTRLINSASNSQDDNFLKPFIDLLLPSDPPKGLPGFAKKDETFTQIASEAKQKLLESKGIILPEQSSAPTPARTMTFEKLIQLIENKKNSEGGNLFVKDHSLDIDVDGAGDITANIVSNPADEKTITASKTSEQRIVKWFDSLLTSENKLSSFEKSSLLYAMTELSVKKQLEQITKKTSPEEKLHIYKDCLLQIKHASVKIAPAIVGDPSATILIPPKLQKLQRQCELQLQDVRAQIRKNNLEGNVGGLNKSSGGPIAISLPPIAVRVENAKVSPGLTTLDISPAVSKWNEAFTDLQNSVKAFEDPASQRVIAKEKIEKTLDTTIARLEAMGSPKAAVAIKLKADLEGLLEDGKIEEISTTLLSIIDNNDLGDFFQKMRNKHFTQTAFQSTHTSQEVYAENFKNTATRLVISPMLLPLISPGEFNGLVQIIDPQTVFEEQYQPIADLFRASNELSHFITPAQRKVYTAQQMEHDYKESIDKALQPALINHLRALSQVTFIPANDSITRDIKALLEDYDNNRTQFTLQDKKNFLLKAKEIGSKLSSQDTPLTINLPSLTLDPSQFKTPAIIPTLERELETILNDPRVAEINSLKTFIRKINDTLQTNSGTTDPAILEGLLKSANALQAELVKLPKDPFAEMRDLQAYAHLAEIHIPALETLEAIDTIDDMADLPPLEDIQNEVSTIPVRIVDNVKGLTSEALEIFKQGAKAQDKAIMKQGYDLTVMLLKALPPMGTERVNGIVPPWKSLNTEERQNLLESLDTLEKMVWEYHMRLGAKDAPTDISLLQVKTQAIRLGLLRQEANDIQNSVQDLLQRTSHSADQGIASRAKKALEDMGVIPLDGPIPPEVKVDFSKLTLSHLEVLAGQINNIEPGQSIPIEVLIVDRYTLPLHEYNFNLTQDLTNLSSLGDNAQRDLTATFHYLVQDLHYGVGDHIWSSSSLDAHSAPARNFVLFPARVGVRDRQISLAEKISSGNISAGSEAIKWSEGLMRGFLYYKSVFDPEFILKDATENKSFLETHPDSLFREEEVTLEIGATPTIINGRGETLAKVSAHGNGVSSERTMNLPVMVAYENAPAPYLVERRKHATYEGWIEYCEQTSLKAPTTISPEILANLFSIRQTTPDIDRNFGTPYASTTLTNALDFVCHLGNLPTLKNDYVQKFLLESMFGPFIAQEGLLEYLPHISHLMPQLEDNLGYCLEKGMASEAAFLATVLSKLQEQVDFALKDMEKGGIAGASLTMLPCWKGRILLAHGLKPYMDRRFDDLRQTELSDADIAKMSSEAYSHPLVQHTLLLQELNARLLNVLSSTGSTLIDSLKELYFESNEEQLKWKIDRFPTEGKTSIYLNVVEQYKEYFSKKENFEEGLEDLANTNFPNDISIMLSAWQTLAAGKNPALKSVRNQNAVLWLENTLRPYLEKNIHDPAIQKELTSAFLRLSPQITSAELSSANSWDFSPPGLFTTTDHLNRKLTLDISLVPTAYIKGEKVVTDEKTVKLPSYLTQRPEVKQALGSNANVTALSRSEGKGTIYKWSHDDQDFELHELDSGNLNSPLEIKRTIDDKTYVFQSLSTLVSEGNVVSKMLHENGVWRIPGTPSGHVFTEGMKKPAKENTFLLEMNAENTKGTLINSSSNFVVGTHLLSKAASPLVFASSENIIASYDKNGVRELRLKGTPLIFDKPAPKEPWECQINGRYVGKLGLANKESENLCVNNFGAHWEQFIIPLQDTNGADKFILIPYKQLVETKQGVKADQHSLSGIPSPEEITISKDGTLQCSLTASLYLANQLLLEANNTKDPSVNRNNCLKAEKLIQKIAQQNAPIHEDEQAQLKNLLLQLQQQSPVALPKMPSNAILSLTLKLRLQIHRLENEFSSPALKLTPEQKFESLETTYKLTAAYQHIKSPSSKESPSQILRAGFDLNTQEKTKLLELVGIFMQDLMKNPSAENHFTEMYGAKSDVTIPIPTDVSSEFLLALLRSAKVPEALSSLSLKHRTNPIAIDELVENFWNYFFTIRNNSLTPSDLLILMQPATLPLNVSPEEKARLQTIDLQARQFLLAYSELKTTGLAKDPKTKLEESLKKSNDDYFKVMSEAGIKDLLTTLKNNAHPLSPLVESVTSKLKQLTVETTKVKVEGKEVEIVDMDSIAKQLNSVKTAIYNVKSEIYRTKEAGKALLHDVKKELTNIQNERSSTKQHLKKLEEAISIVKERIDENERASKKKLDEKKELNESEEPISNTSDVEELSSLITMKQDYEKKLKEIDENEDKMWATNIYNPLINKSMSKKVFLMNVHSFEKNIQTLETTWGTLKTQEESLNKFIEKAQNSATALIELARMDVLFENMENNGFITNPDFKMPEGEKEKAFTQNMLEKIKSDPNFINKDKIGFLKDTVGQLGVIKGAKTLLNLNKVNQSGILQTVESFSLALASILISTNSLMEEKNVHATLSSKKPSSLAPLSEFDENKAAQYLTEEELKAFKEKLASIPENEKTTYLKELSNVLETSEKMASDLMQTSNSIKIINEHSYQIKNNKIQEARPPVQIPAALTKPRMAESELKEFSSLFASDFKATRILDVLEIFAQDKPIDTLIGELPRNLWTKEHTPLILALKDMRSSLGREALQDLLKIGYTNKDELATQFQTKYKEWQTKHHEDLITELQENALPTSEEGIKSQYSQDLHTALENLLQNPPLPFNDVVNAARLPQVEQKLLALVDARQQNINRLSVEAVKAIKEAPFNTLPKELQQLRAIKASDSELLQQALFLNSMNKISGQGELENMLTQYCLESSALKTLIAGQNNAKASLTRLAEVAKLREELSTYLPQAKDRVAVIKKLDALEKEWKAESARLIDYLDRCQSTQDIENLPDSLKPHVRTIAYLQHLHGIVLRKDQFENLDVALQNEATVLTLLMGAGKTSTLMPFLLGIFLQMGHNVIGVLPRTQFGADRKQLDETTQNMLQYAGQEFIFNREQLKVPVSEASLAVLAQNCLSFVESCATHSKYILTTAESKASVDDKIGELEILASRLIENARSIKEGANEDKKVELLAQIARTETALKMLYTIQDIFENPSTRVLTDEIDYILRSNYSVNAEMGKKSAPPPLFTLPVHQLFTVIRDSRNPAIANLNELFLGNEQISMNDEDKINEVLQNIAAEWMVKYADHLPKNYTQTGTAENKLLLEWFSGGPFPSALFENLNTLSADTLFVARAALHQSIRTCLGLKIGLSTNFDPTSNALGVPATQGDTNATTKYSDILMQLCVSQMIATYKPQGEEYTSLAAPSVLTNLRKNKVQLEKDLAENPAKEWLKDEIQLHNDAIQQLSTLVSQKDEGLNDLSPSLGGKEPWKILVRHTFAEQLSSQGLIYTSATQIQRPVQAAFWGCNLTGFTGTATRNVSHLVTATGCKTAMDNVAKTGKSSTAEVIYRIAASLPQGLNTELNTYPTDPKHQLNLLLQKAKDPNERFLINQAGICDHIPPKALVKLLHENADRPIIHVDVTTKRKSVWINGKFKELDKLNPAEKKLVEDKGLFYYHTQHTRGTHFDIPVGSEGSIFLSPTVNANDRDQAFFRARKLGVGHIVKPYISEKDNTAFKTENNLTGNAKLIHLFGKNHEQTYQDEADEAKNAYILRITAPLVKAGDRLRRRMRIDSKPIQSSVQSRGLSAEQVNEKLATSKIQSDIIQAFQSIYSSDTSTLAYMNGLRSEGRKGISVDTPDYLRAQIANRQTKLLGIQSELSTALFTNPPFDTNDLLKNNFKKTLTELMASDAPVADKINTLKQISTINSAPLSMFIEAFEEVFQAKHDLDLESERIHQEIDEIRKELKPKTASAGQSNQTSETEAEAEEQQEQEIQSADVDVSSRNRDNNGREFFNEINQDIFSTLDMNPTMDFRSLINTLFEPSQRGTNKFANVGNNLWSESCVVSKRLAQQLEKNPLDLKNVAILFTENDKGELRIILCDLLSEANYILSPLNASRFTQIVKSTNRNHVSKPINFSVFRPLPNDTGDLTLSPLGSALSMKGLNEEVLNENENEAHEFYQAEAFLGLLHIGFTYMTDDQYKITASYFQKQTPAMQTQIEESLKQYLSKTNPDLYHRAMKKLKQ